MAEIGIIASGMGVASLGLQLMDGVRKLKQFWDEVKEASEDIQYALEELDALSLVLSDIHTSNSNLPSIPSATVTRCLELCRRGTDILNTTVKDLNGAISKRRKIGSAKVVLKQDTLDKFRNRLRDAQYMLMLSRQTYSDALQMEYHKLQIEAVQNNANRQLRGFEELKVSIIRSTNVMSSTLLQSRDAVVYDYETKRPMRGRTRTKLDKQAKRFQKKFSTPQLFSSSSYTWDFSGYQAPSGWTFNFRQYYTVGRNSPTWMCVLLGDVSGLQALFQSKRATPFDRNPRGTTLLDLASSEAEYDMCRLLLDQGADPNDSFKLVLRLLYPVSEVHNPLNDLSIPHMDCENLSWLLNKTDPTFNELSLEERMMLTLKHCSEWDFVRHSIVDIVSLMLHKDPLNEVCCKMTFRCSRKRLHTFLSIEQRCFLQLLHIALEGNEELGNCLGSTQPRIGKAEFELGGRFSKTEFSKSIEFLKRLIVAGSDIRRGKFLFSSLVSIPRDHAGDLFQSWICTVSQRLWLEILHDSGIDLLKYGKVEHDKLLEISIAWECYVYPQEIFDTGAHLISFVYGPAPEDWKFWYSLDEPYRNYYKNFRDFWELVDHPERGMPGAWEEY
ncbi:uncharacterized protein EAE97_005299 [Botrytis byssoidea]|uniref:Fungal N-terminal domain-containing protein n=1 Tax=Botrytis byssoidea TaxID=139641 RepID=A0A9P5IRP4_9HELO|nr:uncharacterized protein EAE97_005299 [Botrytis byssoidea]KAF7944666.1 hypothetical protein EAE97_005299 [Botrytis byssoidea]